MATHAGKVALITGASAGIGAALARELARDGADLVLAARREDRLRDLAREIETTGRNAIVVGCDVTRDGDLERAVAAAVERYGRLDIAIANAGFGVVGPVEELRLDDFRRQLETNVLGVLRTLYASLPELRKTRGQFVIVGSVAGHVPTPATSAYCMSKFAVRGFAESIHDELAASGVSVTLVSPGFVDSDIRRVDNHGKVHEERARPGARMAADAHRPGCTHDRAGHPPPASGGRRDGTRQGAGASVSACAVAAAVPHRPVWRPEASRHPSADGLILERAV